MGLKVYISGMSGNKEVKKRQQRVLMILDSKNIKYNVVDITEPGKESEKELMQAKSTSNGATVSDPEPRYPLPPQIFNEEEYCGDYDAFDLANEIDTLEQFLKLAPADTTTVSSAQLELKQDNSDVKGAAEGEGDEDNKENLENLKKKQDGEECSDAPTTANADANGDDETKDAENDLEEDKKDTKNNAETPKIDVEGEKEEVKGKGNHGSESNNEGLEGDNIKELKGTKEVLDNDTVNEGMLKSSDPKKDEIEALDRAEQKIENVDVYKKVDNSETEIKQSEERNDNKNMSPKSDNGKESTKSAENDENKNDEQPGDTTTEVIRPEVKEDEGNKKNEDRKENTTCREVEERNNDEDPGSAETDIVQTEVKEDEVNKKIHDGKENIRSNENEENNHVEPGSVKIDVIKSEDGDIKEFHRVQVKGNEAEENKTNPEKIESTNKIKTPEDIEAEMDDDKMCKLDNANVKKDVITTEESENGKTDKSD